MYKFLVKKIDFLIPLIVIAFAFFIAYHNVGSGIINYIDHNFPFYFSDYLHKLFFTWSDWIYLGSNQSTSLTNGISYYLIFYLFERLGCNYVLINRLEYVISIFFIIYFTYLFLHSLFKEKVSILHKFSLVLVSTFFLTNLSATGLFTDGLSQAVFAMSGIPLVLYSLRKYGLTNRKIFLLLMTMGSLIITSFNLPYSVIFMVAVLLLALSFNDIRFKQKIKNYFLFLIIWLLVNSFWILPMFYSIFIAPPYQLKEVIDNVTALRSVMDLTAIRYTLDYLLGLTINLDIIKIQNADYSTILNFFSGKWFILLSFITVIGVFLRHFILKKEKNTPPISPLFLIGTFLFFLFFAKGLNQPFGNLYSCLFDKTTFFKMFRDSLKWMSIPFFAMTILMAYILTDHSKKWLKGIVVLYLLVNLFPWVYNGLAGSLRAYNIPGYYFDLRDYYMNIPDATNKRAFILDSVVAPTSFDFDIKTNDKKNLSNNILKFISPIPTVDLFSNGGGISSDYIQNIFKHLTKTDNDLAAFKALGITHVYQQHDFVKASTYDYTDAYFDKKTFGKIDVYEIKKDDTLPKVQLIGTKENATLGFMKINPTKYKLFIKNIKLNTDLKFLYTIDQNWKLYEDRHTSDLLCTPVESYKSVKTTECKGEQKFFEGEELSYLYKKPIFDDTHQLVSDYANQWTIDPDYIKQHFSKDYYKENPDGSINIELTLYFKPQSYFYLGLLISSTTLLGCLGYLGWVVVGRKKKKRD